MQALTQPEVTELRVESGRPPYVKRGETLEVFQRQVLSADDILVLLFAAGGSRYVDDLEHKPAQWSARIAGIGTIGVTALMQGGGVRARLALTKREAGGVASLSKPAARSARGSGGHEAVKRTTDRPPRRRSAPPRARTSSPPGEPAFPYEAPPKKNLRTSPTPVERPGELGGPAKRGLRTSSLSGRSVEADGSARNSLRTSPTPVEQAIELDESARRSLRTSPTPSERAPALDASGRRPGRTSALPVAPMFELDAPGKRSAPPVPKRARGNSAPAILVAPAAGPAPRGALTTSSGAAQPRGWDELLSAARKAGASDIHLVATRPPLLRIAGELAPTNDAPLDPASLEAMTLARIPPPARERFDRDGSTDFALAHPEMGRFRVNVARQQTGIKVCLRLIAAEPPTLASLGMPEEIAQAIRHHQGLILLTGPSGHGKSSTLAALVDRINATTAHHVISVEDPVEFVHPRKRALISQREVGSHTRSLAAALKASLREDPDVIVVGDVRDPETARMALAASETGHLVLGTMNTPSAAKTIERMIDLFPPGDQPQVRMGLAGGLKLVVSQRLLPNTAGDGMVAAAELLPGSVPLWNLIRDSKTFQIPSLQQRGKSLGVIRLDDSLAALVESGKTTLDAARAVAESPSELEATLRAKRVAAAAPQAAGDAPQDQGLFAKAGALFAKKRG